MCRLIAVGYSQSNLATFGDIKLVCPQFIGVGDKDGKVAIESIDLPHDKTAKDLVAMMTLFGDGATDQTYLWQKYDGEYCWYDYNNDQKAEGITFQPGEALWVQCDSEDEDNPVPFKSSGEVSQKDYEIELATFGDIVICGNATPVEVDIQDILCPADKTAKDLVTVMTLFGDGATDQTYLWQKYDGEYCWYDYNNDQKAEGVTIKPGQGLWVQCDSEDEDNPVIMTFPGVEL